MCNNTNHFLIYFWKKPHIVLIIISSKDKINQTLDQKFL